MPNDTMPAGVNALILPHLDVGRREHRTVSPGTTIAEMVSAGLPGLSADDRALVRVTIGEHVVPEVNWARVRPKPGATVVIRVVPAGDAFRSILGLIVTVAAIVIGQYWLGPLIAGPSGLGLSGVGGAEKIGSLPT